MNNKIKAIETVYKGCRMRSRLEARWAVCLDKLGISWEYEPEGFDLEGAKYIPDFYLPGLGVYFEVKPPEGMSEDATNKAYQLVRTTHKTLVFSGDPFAISNESNRHSPMWRFFYLDYKDFQGVRNLDDTYFGECSACGEIQLCGRDFWDSTGRSIASVNCECYKDIDIWTDSIEAAYSKARKARFEFGENG